MYRRIFISTTAAGLTFCSVIVWIAFPIVLHGAERLSVFSPDGRLSVAVELADTPTERAAPTYQLGWSDKKIILPSQLGLMFKEDPLHSPFEVVSHAVSSSNETWNPLHGERSVVRDHFNQLSVTLKESEAPHRVLRLEFRAYDAGLALRYCIPEQDGLDNFTIQKERTEFRLADDHAAWNTYSSQQEYEKTIVSALRSGCERPLTLEASDGTHIAIAEARQLDYSRMRLGRLLGVDHALVTEIEGPVTSDAPFVTPWRIVMVAPDAGKLLENNDIFLNLNDPCEIADTSWIKPGKVIRDVSLTTEGSKACVDFCVEHNLQYIIVSAGWYGNEFTSEANATTVTLDPERSKGPLNLEEVIRYGEERGIGVLVYVNRNQLEPQLPGLHPLYAGWGLKGIKYGFVRTGSQEWTNWLHEAIRDAAKHRQVINVHDDYRPTGFSRTYPNLMTVEGIRGDEESPTTQHTLITLFTRMLAGRGDNTICYFAPRVTRMGSHGAQLAKTVCLFSPMQWLYWYDRPAGAPVDNGGAGGATTVVQEVPELEFFDAVPTVWDDTKVVHGKIGEHAVIARRSGKEWFIGALNGAKGRKLTIPLDFLTPGSEYEASLYSDDSEADTATHIRIDRVPVNHATVLRSELRAMGGQAMRIVPKP